MHVLIIDDHQLFANGLKLTVQGLHPEWHVESFDTVTEALSVVTSKHDIDLILLDLDMAPGKNGERFLCEIRLREIWTPVIIVSAVEHVPRIQKALQMGASGFISKSAAPTLFSEAMQTVLQGDSFLQPSLRIQLEALNEVKEGDSLEGGGLTSKQIEVIKLVAEGLSNKEIARRLGVSTHTVKAHLAVSFRVLGAKNRTDCVVEAEKLGLINH